MSLRATVAVLDLIPDKFLSRDLWIGVLLLLRFRHRVRLNGCQQFDVTLFAFLQVDDRAVGRIRHHRFQPAADGLLRLVNHRSQCPGIGRGGFAAVGHDDVTDESNNVRGNSRSILNADGGIEQLLAEDPKENGYKLMQEPRAVLKDKMLKS